MTTIVITKEGLKRAQKELTVCMENRANILIAIEDAQNLGDLRENSEYHEARNMQRMNESKILELEYLIKQAQVVDTDNERETGDRVRLGTTVTVTVDKGNKRTLKIVGFNETNPTAGMISNQSPIGMALLGRKLGEEVEITLPTRKAIYKIEEIR